MSDTSPTLEEALVSIAKLEKALESERGAHKATKEAARRFRASIAQRIGLAENADDEAIAARLADTEAIVFERTRTLTAERDAAVQRPADIEARWASERVDAALRHAYEQSGARPEHLEDFLALARSIFSIDETGAVRTRKDAANTLPGIDPAAWIHGELKAKRPFWWPTSVGGGSKGGGGVPVGGDDSCFRPGPTWNLTAQFAYEARHGAGAADAARRRYGGVRR